MMAVAEKPIVETAPRRLQGDLATSSLLGGIYLLASFWIVFAGVAALWNDVLGLNEALNPFLSGALLLLVNGAVLVGAFVLGWYLEKSAQPPRGTRAGAVFVAVAIFVILWLGRLIGEGFDDGGLGAMGAGLTLAIVGGLLFLTGRLLFRPGFGRWLVNVEEGGWFHAVPYKPSQGLRVRRGTIIGLLALGLTGIYTMLLGPAFGSPGGDWTWTIPFTDGLYVPLLFNVNYTRPLIFAVLLGWFAWRVVNWPKFADFLIATEAEMNKVSWTTRRRLFQDTIVVLITVALLAAFLFVVDILWIRILSWEPIGVLKVDIRAEQLKRQDTQQW